MSLRIFGKQKDAEIGVFAYLSTEQDTTTTAAGTFYKLEGLFTNEILCGCSACGGILTYTDSVTRCLKIIINATLKTDTNNTTVTMGIYKNGALEINSQMQTKLVQVTDRGTIPLVDVIELSTGDTIEIRIASDKAGAKVTATFITASAAKFY